MESSIVESHVTPSLVSDVRASSSPERCVVSPGRCFVFFVGADGTKATFNYFQHFVALVKWLFTTLGHDARAIDGGSKYAAPPTLASSIGMVHTRRKHQFCRNSSVFPCCSQDLCRVHCHLVSSYKTVFGSLACIFLWTQLYPWRS